MITSFPTSAKRGLTCDDAVDVDMLASCRNEKLSDTMESTIQGLQLFALTEKRRRKNDSESSITPALSLDDQLTYSHAPAVSRSSGICVSPCDLLPSARVTFPFQSVAHSGFEAVTPRYLAFRPGDVITVLLELREGWLFGLRNDDRGEFPPYKLTKLDELRHDASEGNAAAQMELGVRYDNGYGVAENAFKAALWYRLAAEKGFSRAQYKLALCLDAGQGVPKDESEAVVWYKKAARQNHAGAQYNLAVCFQMGTGVSVNLSKAMKWFHYAASTGHTKAQYEIACMLVHDDCIPKEFPVAAGWFCKAAKSGHADAQRKLGWCYEFGLGVAQDEKRAVKWYSRSAELGNTDAKCRLALCLENGSGIAKDERRR